MLTTPNVKPPRYCHCGWTHPGQGKCLTCHLPGNPAEKPRPPRCYVCQRRSTKLSQHGMVWAFLLCPLCHERTSQVFDG